MFVLPQSLCFSKNTMLQTDRLACSIANATNLKTEVVVQFRNHRSNTSTNKTRQEYKKKSQTKMHAYYLHGNWIDVQGSPTRIWSVLLVYRQAAAVHRSRLLGQTWSWVQARMHGHASINHHTPGPGCPSRKYLLGS